MPPLNSDVRHHDMATQPSHTRSALGGLWTALGFVPYDIWVGQARVDPPQLLGLCWMLMGVIFLWAPLRFLVVGCTVGKLMESSASMSAAARRAVTWALSCAAAGMALSLVALGLGYEAG